MTPQQNPLPTEAGEEIKHSTALRIATNIAVDDKELTEKQPPQWFIDDLYEYLERVWNFIWDREVQIWVQK